jgi:hypothetical protein
VHISFAVFADAANLSQEGKLNVLGIFDALQVHALPTLHPRAHFVVRVKGTSADIGTHQLTFHSTNPHDSELWTSAGELQVEGGAAPGTDLDLPIIAVVDLPLDSTGQYTMRVELDGEPVQRVNLFVNGPPVTLAFPGSPPALVS